VFVVLSSFVVVGLLLLSTLDGVPNSITGKGGSSGFVDVGVLEAPALRKLLIRFFLCFLELLGLVVLTSKVELVFLWLLVWVQQLLLMETKPLDVW
jgi:hypothetical protein